MVAAESAPSKLGAVRALPQHFRDASAVDASDWDDWRWQARHAVTSFRALDEALTLTEAERIGASCLVLGSRGHGALYRALLGSVSEGLLREARRPIVFVPDPRAPETT